jgi:hypothetical protein
VDAFERKKCTRREFISLLGKAGVAIGIGTSIGTGLWVARRHWGDNTELLLHDLYDSELEAGSVSATSATPGPGTRFATDVEGALSVENGKLRLARLDTAGWQRLGIAYGPYVRETGLAFAVRLAVGDVQGDADILAAGFFADANPADPLTDGNAFVFRDNASSGGQLGIAETAFKQVIGSIKQVETYLVCILRESGAAYYIASVEGARDLAAYPNMRPIGIDSTSRTASVYAGIFQRQVVAHPSVVSAVKVKLIEDFATWYGTAHAADNLTRSGSLGHVAERGGRWRLKEGAIHISAKGAKAEVAGNSTAILFPGSPFGLIHMVVETGSSPKTGNVLFRYVDDNNYWRLYIEGGSHSFLERVINGVAFQYGLTGTSGYVYQPDTLNTVQILDHGNRIRCFLNNEEIAESGGVVDITHREGAGIGFQFGHLSDLWIRNFEAHPRNVAIPEVLLMEAPYQRKGEMVAVSHDFPGSPGTDLEGRPTAPRGKAWTRSLGKAILERTGNNSVRVRGTAPQDTYYTVSWDDPGFADLKLTITPPGSAYGQGHRCRAGIIFWQDMAHYLCFRYLTDDGQYNAAEIEGVLSHGKFQAVFRRIVFGTDIFPGVTGNLRATFDGENFICYRDAEAAITSSVKDIDPTFSPLTINRVGIGVGVGDTGSLMTDFEARV